MKNIQELIEVLFPSNKECYLCGYKGSMVGLIGHECKSPLDREIQKKKDDTTKHSEILNYESVLKNTLYNKDKA